MMRVSVHSGMASKKRMSAVSILTGTGLNLAPWVILATLTRSLPLDRPIPNKLSSQDCSHLLSTCYFLSLFQM